MSKNQVTKCSICGSHIISINLDESSVILKCKNCNHIFRDLDLCFANAREHAWGGDSVFNKLRNLLTLRRISKLFFKGNDKLNICEIGFGDGFLLKKMFEKGHSISGVDKGSLDKPIDPIIRKNGNLYNETAENVELPKEKYDLIYGIHVIEHIKEIKKTLININSALKPGGYLYFITPNSESGGLKLFKTAWWNFEDPTHISFFSAKSAKTLLESCGFTVSKINIPVWESLMVEINSFFRLLNKDSEKTGILNNLIVKVLDLLLLPVSFFIRLIYPKIASSIEIIAKKIIQL